MSWFSSLESAAESLSQIQIDPIEALSKIGEISNKVQDVLPPIDRDLINKLTLRSDDLVKEHDALEAQEKRKEIVHDYLSSLLPWETKDEARAILIDQCREAILELSKKESTFVGPFSLPAGMTMFHKVAEESSEENLDGKETEQDISEEQKLEKMKPLPVLLEQFDIDIHVGLIERLLKEDENLVSKHSNLSGAGEKEAIFWKNYFFHVAYVRYSKGLSIDEIWSRKPKLIITDDLAALTSSNHNETSLHDFGDDDASVEMEFEEQSEVKSEQNSVTSETKSSQPTTKSTSEYSAHSPSEIKSTKSESSGSGTSYEVVESNKINDLSNLMGDLGDLEDLDDLEAEIERELGEY